MHPVRALFPLALVSSLGPTAAAQTGSVLRAHHINELIPVVQDDAYLGSSVAGLGDLDGDGIGDLAVGAPTEWDFFSSPTHPGSVWILFLDASGAPRGQIDITRGTAGFTAAMVDGDRFGSSLAALGDLDGDGLPELAVASANGGIPTVFVLFLRADGTVRTHTEIHYDDPVFGSLVALGDGWGSLSEVGDLDGDGLRDLAIGAPGDDDGPGHDTGALWLTYMKADGTPRAAKKISQTSGGFTGPLITQAYFGRHAGALGDLDGDGNGDLAVFAYGGRGYEGGMWILFLDASQDVRSAREILGDEFFPGWFPNALAVLGDVDGDGLCEVAQGYHDFIAGGTDRGGITIAFLRSDGSVRKHLLLTHERGGLGPLPGSSGFGIDIAPLGDQDGDGTPDLATGALYDGREDHGGAWVLYLDGSPLRNGSGANPLTLSEASEPVLGQTWIATLDCSAHAAGLALLAGWSRPSAGTMFAQGELLVDLASARLFAAAAAHAGAAVPFAAAVPLDPALIGLSVFTQGMCTGAPGARLGNALDVLVGR